jgi:hypothetical protein
LRAPRRPVRDRHGLRLRPRQLNPKANLAALGPAFNYRAVWSVMAGLEIDDALSQPETAEVRTV